MLWHLPLEHKSIVTLPQHLDLLGVTHFEEISPREAQIGIKSHIQNASLGGNCLSQFVIACNHHDI